MSRYKLDKELYAVKARQAAAEGCVLLKNENQTLPLKSGDKVAVFGRIASTYYKSGLGSGGMVNAEYVIGILDALREEKEISVIESVRDVYDAWIKDHPFDEGAGWGQVPWSQAEMPVSDELFAAAEDADVALVVIGRTAGEDQDNSDTGGSYRLTAEEEMLIAEVSKRFERTAVLLNVGNIIDMSWVESCEPAAVMYVWQGGQEGGHGIVDVLTGRTNPCGHLTDTIAKRIEDYPSHPYFGRAEKNYYTEDIYVGYRYFETFAKDSVLYPFGYGLSYTTFAFEGKVRNLDTCIEAEVKVTNTGVRAGKEVVQIYVGAPCGNLGKPALVLVDFEKTGVIEPGESETVLLIISKASYASFDDSGITGHKNAFVLEEGEYHIFVGENVESVISLGNIFERFCVVEQLEEALAPAETFERFKNAEGHLVMEPVPVRTATGDEHRQEKMLEKAKYTGDQGYKLSDVYYGTVDLDTFVAQLSAEDLIYMARGEGMCSPKVTPGTAAAFGGLTESLQTFGIPALCASDGPSGIRMSCGTKAFSLPNGTLLGCTFDKKLVRELYELTGRELRQNRIDTLLGPGMNIHRYPLNGRNFEYISEDPVVTGKISAAQIIGMSDCGSTGTAKHFATNNQESNRSSVNAVVSARALREIYLKGFEIAVKEGQCRSIMTTYAPLNGLWTSGNYDLNTKILREQWGFDGIVMTDWWAVANDEGQPADKRNHAAMVRSGNDLCMVVEDASDQVQDNILEQYGSGVLTREELARNAKNILKFALKSVAMQYEIGAVTEEELKERKAAQKEEDRIPENLTYYRVKAEESTVIPMEGWHCDKDQVVHVGITVGRESLGLYEISLSASSELNELAQMPLSVYLDGELKAMIGFRGTERKTVVEKRELGYIMGNHYMKLVSGASGLKIDEVRINCKKKVESPL